MALAPITAKASLDATEFTAGVLEIRKRLNELNTAYESNKAEMKQLGNREMYGRNFRVGRRAAIKAFYK